MAEPEAPDRPDVEISLVSTNNRELVQACLRSLPAACEGLTWRVTVVDNASTDGTAEMVGRDFPHARLLRNDHRLGFSANHNQVVQPLLDAGGARYVLILNEDTELDAGSVARLVAFADEHARAGVVGPEIVGADGERQPSSFPFPRARGQFVHTLLPGRMPRTCTAGGWLNGSCLLVRVAALQEVGPLDERFFIFFEDTDLCYRMHNAGWESVLVSSARILHHGHMTVSQPALGSAMERQMLRSRYLYFEKHHGRRQAHRVANAVRLALFVRAAKAWVEEVVPRKNRLDTASMLARLAKYDPSRDASPTSRETPR